MTTSKFKRNGTWKRVKNVETYRRKKGIELCTFQVQRFPLQLRRQLKAVCAAKSITVTKVIVRLITKYIKEHQDEAARAIRDQSHLDCT